MCSKLDGSEHVLVVPQQAIDRLSRWQGFRAYAPHELRAVLDELLEHALFIPRTEDLEHGPGGLAFKQLVAYAVLTRGAGGPSPSVFAFRRPAKGGDSRLRDRFSIGLGGHINPVDGPGPGLKLRRIGQTVVQNGMMRELHEEVRIASGISLHLAGLLNDDSNDVGRRHVGVVYRVEVGPATVQPAKAEVLPIGWLSPRELRDARLEWETWSAIAIAGLDGILGHRAAAAAGKV